jgi:hypothetical protein
MLILRDMSLAHNITPKCIPLNCFGGFVIDLELGWIFNANGQA